MQKVMFQDALNQTGNFSAKVSSSLTGLIPHAKPLPERSS
jgi:hypothetical protein